MPWLIRDKPDNADNLLFVHVPRCGGTSLTQHFSVAQKCLEGRSLWGRCGMKFFFYKYKLFESANFPIWSRENFVALILLSISIFLHLDGKDREMRESDFGRLDVFFFALSIIWFVLLTFVFTAPVVGRITWVRRGYLFLIHYPLLRFMESIEWCTGTNKTGYMMHETAQKMLAYGYVTPETMNKVCSMAIVRNPYSRMISVYMYNRYGPMESFQHFVKDWYKIMRYYRERGEMEEWYTPCHCIPQFEFTHFEGKQLVQSVVKQEELKLLKSEDGAKKAIDQDNSVAELPTLVRNALLGMPHTNSRKTGKKWWDYYDQETLDMTYELYKRDFEIFKYSPELDNRPDLKPPALVVVEVGVEKMKRNSLLGPRGQRLSLMTSARMTLNGFDEGMLSNEELVELLENIDKEKNGM